MKRILSCFLCFILVLGLVPTTVLAADSGTTPEEGLYITYENGELDGILEIGPVPISGPSGVVFEGYTVKYASGQDAVAYYYCPEKTCEADTMMGGLIVEQVEGTSVYKVVPDPNYSGYGQIYVDSEPIWVYFEEGPISEERPLTESDRSGPLPDNAPGFAYFEYNGTKYLIAPTDGIAVNDRPLQWSSITVNEFSTGTLSFYVGFWRVTKDGHFLVDTDTRDELLRAFGDTLTLNLYATEDHQQTYPAEVFYDTQWPCGRAWEFNAKMDGSWKVRVTGSIDGQEIDTFGMVSWLVHKEVFAGEEIDTVDEINAWLKTLTAQERTTYIAKLCEAAGENAHSGTIEIPAGLGNVAIEGGSQYHDPSSTQLKGGIMVGEDSTLLLAEITLIGAGKDNCTWEDGTTPNYGVWGAGNVQYSNAVLRDFYHGIHCEGQLSFGGGNTTFQSNHVGLYLNTSVPSGGNLEMGIVLFKENDIALEFAGISSGFPFTMYRIFETCFIDNSCDIKNSTGRKYFVTGNYFEHDGNTTAVVDTGKWTEGPVYVCPVYTVYEDGNFSELYWGKKATMSNDDAGKYPVPKNKLNGKFTVIDQPDTANETSVTFDFGEEEAQTISTFSLRRTVEETFDATVVIEKTDTTISLTINDLPSGKTPTITVPCGDWYDATVTYNGNAVTSTYSGGSVSFVAEQGGTYIIQRKDYVPVIPLYPIKVTSGENGTAYSAALYAAYGSTITITAKPDEGYAVAAVVVTDAFGNELVVTDKGNGKYTFRMPAARVNVSVLFESELPYTDVSVEHKHYDAIAYLYRNGFMIGTGNGTTFEPDTGLSRAMMATILYRIAGEPEVKYSGAFSDVEADTWYTDAVEWAAQTGVVYGVGNDLFDPLGQLTFEQIIVMLYRCAGTPAVTEDRLWDNTSAWAVDAMCWAVENDILDGENDFEPKDIILRAEVAQLLMNYLEQ